MNNHFLLSADITWLSSGSVMTQFESIVHKYTGGCGLFRNKAKMEITLVSK